MRQIRTHCRGRLDTAVGVAAACALLAAVTRPDRKLYTSYIGGPIEPEPVDAYELLGLDLAITSGVADSQRAMQSQNYSLVSQSTHVTGKLGGPGSWPAANGGVTGLLNSARIGALRIAPLAADGEAP